MRLQERRTSLQERRRRLQEQTTRLQERSTCLEEHCTRPTEHPRGIPEASQRRVRGKSVAAWVSATSTANNHATNGLIRTS